MDKLLLSIFPQDVVSIVLYHVKREVSASKIQSSWRRYSCFSHAARREWKRVLSNIGEVAHRRLIPYSLVRREWRMEAENWAVADEWCVNRIVLEAEDEGLWGEKREMLSERISERISRVHPSGGRCLLPWKKARCSEFG